MSPTDMGLPALEVRAVRVAFDGTPVLDGASLTLAPGEIIALRGPSGSGKSTLLRVIAGILPADDGTIAIDGHDVSDVPTHRRGVGMVFQDNQLFPHLSVLDNVAFGSRMRGVGRAHREAAAREWLARVGLDGFGSRQVTELSGGEAKRVALARTLAPEPSIVLLDEPLTGLDRELHDRLATELADLLRAAEVTSLLVTHDAEEADTIADRTIEIADLVPFRPSPRPLSGDDPDGASHTTS